MKVTALFLILLVLALSQQPGTASTAGRVRQSFWAVSADAAKDAAAELEQRQQLQQMPSPDRDWWQHRLQSQMDRRRKRRMDYRCILHPISCYGR
ncbi:hypothetical protein BOX15_Mlig009589g1 [Macrostomum lignano]|uniref:Uncharacterized protein n=1 Tax=Macrostomum lignano TaxID=282301 RepID=A0A267G394_9PLAT|nr:hypothetical protein BOX15_Mlig009589g2 [Macrostomum lignano]PAA80541.1 hypothetical protein BOX15_Mlig009589g1 [Macrostomum lignano]